MSDPLVESADVSDTGVHLPGAAPGSGPVDSALSLLGSLLSLPPRAHKRRRGSRFKSDDAADESHAAPTPEQGAAAPAVAAASGSAATPARVDRPWRERKFEYLDHTADIQLHSWGDTLQEALEQVVLAMFGYITDLTRVEIDPARTDTFSVQGHDLDSLLFNLLDEFLYRFSTNEWIVRDVMVESLDLNKFTCRVTGYGEGFTLAKHTQGTEVKAITYSNMQIFVNGVRVKSDNDAAGTRKDAATAAAAASAAAASSSAAPAATPAHPHPSSPAPGDEVPPPPEAGVIVDDREESLQDAEAVLQRGTHGADIYVIVDI